MKDAKAPSINSLSFDKYSFYPEKNETIKVTARLKDDLSGIQGGDDTIYPEGSTSPQLHLENGKKQTNVILKRVSGTNLDGIYEGTFKPRKFKGGNWTLTGITIYDDAGNNADYFDDRDDDDNGLRIPYKKLGLTAPVTLSAKETKSDSTSPTINSLNFDKYSFYPKKNETIKVTARLKDDLSGIQGGDDTIYPEGSTPPQLHLENGKKQTNVILKRVSGTNLDGIYEGTFKPRKFKGGNWTLTGITIYDDAGNNADYFDDRDDDDNGLRIPYKKLGLTAPVTLSAKETKSDSTSPTINSLNFDKYSFYPEKNETIKVTARLKDDLSGIQGGDDTIYPEGSTPPQLHLENGKKQTNVILKRVSGTNLDGIYEGTFKPRKFKGGNWTLTGIIIYDDAGNNADYFNDRDDDDDGLRIPYKKLGLTAPVTLSAISQLTHTGKFNKKSADKITNFNPSTDTLKIDINSFGIDRSATFAAGKNKKQVKKKLAKQDFDFLYDEKKGGLYFNENGADKGFGDGGMIAILKGSPDLTGSNLEFI